VIVCCLVRADENGTKMEWWLPGWNHRNSQKTAPVNLTESKMRSNPQLNSQTPVWNCFKYGTAYRQKTQNHNAKEKSLIYYALHHIYPNIRWGLFPNPSLVKLQWRDGKYVIITHTIKHVQTSSGNWRLVGPSYLQVNRMPVDVYFRLLALWHLDRK